MIIDRKDLETVVGGGWKGKALETAWKWGERAVHGVHTGSMGYDAYQSFTGNKSGTQTAPAAPVVPAATTTNQE